VKSLTWLALVWSEICAIAFTWLSLSGYRNPDANRATRWLYRLYGSLSGDPVGGGVEYARRRMLENVVLGGLFSLAGLALAIKELLK
jgi:hypothetical protein